MLLPYGIINIRGSKWRDINIRKSTGCVGEGPNKTVCKGGALGGCKYGVERRRVMVTFLFVSFLYRHIGTYKPVIRA